jgi:hypothetical protein
MEIAEGFFAGFNDFVYISYACAGGGGAGCVEHPKVSGRILSFDYINREIMIDPILTGEVTLEFLRENLIGLTSEKYIKVKHVQVSRGQKHNAQIYIKRAITELLNMNLLNNTQRCNELKPKINELYKKIDDTTLY